MGPGSPRRWPHLGNALSAWFDELSADGIFFTDNELRIRAWNRWLQERTGHTSIAVLGRPLFDLYPDLVSRGLDQFYRDAVAGEARIVAQRFHGHLIPIRGRAPADPMPQSARIAPLKVDGRIVGTVTVIEDVTERVTTEQELRNQIAALEQARATAEAAVRTKDEFLATLSHELRTPLNAVLGWTRLMRSGQMDQATLRRALEVVDRNATAQAQLIDDILDVARVMQGKLRLNVQTMDLVPVVLAAVDAIRPAAQAKRVTLVTNVDPHGAIVTGDDDRLQQVVWNLLSNAVKFTPLDGRIEIRLRTTNDRAQVVVSDSGKGIAADFLPYVFDRFRQEDSTTTRRYGGLGLGLSLVRQLVELHGGNVAVESEGENRGSTFTVTIPLQPPPEVTGAASSVASPRACDLSSYVILVIDDEEDAREVLTAALAQYGAHVESVSSASEAYRALERDGNQPHVIIADVGMPDEDGYAMIRKIRALERQAGTCIPAIAVSGYAGPEDRDRALASGFHRHFAKPVDPLELANTVADLLRSTS